VRTDTVVLFQGRLIAHVDPKKFEVLGGQRARDDRRYYQSGVPVEKLLWMMGSHEIRWEPMPGIGGFLVSVLCLLMSIQFGALSWLIDRLTGPTDAPEPRARDRAKDAAELDRFATLLAAHDSERLAPVLQWMRDADDDSEAFEIFEEGFSEAGLIGRIDHRSFTSETVELIEPMLQRHGVRDFDWSFIGKLERLGDGAELRNENFLTLLRDQLRRRGLTLAHLDHGDDGFGFALLRADDFDSVNGLQAGYFVVRDEFGADEACERGRKLLMAD
jgi:hypothetical protein